MWAVEVKYPNGVVETVSCNSIAEGMILLRALQDAPGVTGRLVADGSTGSHGNATPVQVGGQRFGGGLPEVAARAGIPSPDTGALAPQDPISPSPVVAGATPLGPEPASARFPGAVPPPITATATPVADAEPRTEDTPLGLKVILWRAMHRVTMASVPWSDDFAALIAAMSALLRVHQVTVTAPLENLAVLHPTALLVDAKMMVTLVGKFGRVLTPWPEAFDGVVAAALRMFQP